MIEENGNYRTEADEKVLVLKANTGKDLGEKRKEGKNNFTFLLDNVERSGELSKHFMDDYISIVHF